MPRKPRQTFPNVLREFDAQEHTAAQVKAEVDMHLAEKERLEATMPSSIVVGAFWINTENVRQSLAKKRKALGNAVLELLAKKLRNQADEVIAILLRLLMRFIIFDRLSACNAERSFVQFAHTGLPDLGLWTRICNIFQKFDSCYTEKNFINSSSLKTVHDVMERLPIVNDLFLDQLCPTQMAYWAKKSCHYLNQGRTFYDILIRAAYWMAIFNLSKLNFAQAMYWKRQNNNCNGNRHDKMALRTTYIKNVKLRLSK